MLCSEESRAVLSSRVADLSSYNQCLPGFVPVLIRDLDGCIALLYLSGKDLRHGTVFTSDFVSSLAESP